MRLTEKITSGGFISLFPEHITENNPGFVAFIRAYYEYMEQSEYPQEIIQNSPLYDDIDTTLDSFIDFFMKEYCGQIPNTVLFDRRELVKNINSLYSTKGSELSYELLFRIMFNIDVESFYPKRQILRPSDGKWIRNVTIFLDIQVGQESDIENKTTIIRNPEGTTRNEIRIGAARHAENIYGPYIISEFYIDDSYNIPIQPGDIIDFDGFRAVVVPIINSYEIFRAGIGFRLGDIITVRMESGDRTRVKVTKINSDGGILAIQFISFGAGYGDKPFYSQYSSIKGYPEKVPFSLNGPTLSLNDVISNIEDEGRFWQQNYAGDYFKEDYVGITGTLFKNSTGVNTGEITHSLGTNDDAVILFRPGAKASYPGYYKTNDSFISDDIYIEDEHYYQLFSYVLRSEQRLRDYKKIVIDNIHPAGTKLFAEYLLKTNVVTDSHIFSTSNVWDEIIDDSIELTDIIDNVEFEFGLNPIDDYTIEEEMMRNVEKFIEVEVDVPDYIIRGPGKDITEEEEDAVTVVDNIEKEPTRIDDDEILAIDEKEDILVIDIDDTVELEDQAQIIWL